MQRYDPARLAHDLSNWMNDRYLEPISDLEGGWEEWIQADFPAWLDATDAMQYDFRREIRVPGVGRIDWVINLTLNQEAPTAIEIKAQSPKYVNDVLAALILADMAKLQALQGYAHRIMMVAVLDGELQKRLENNHFVQVARSGNAALLVHEV